MRLLRLPRQSAVPKVVIGNWGWGVLLSSRRDRRHTCGANSGAPPTVRDFRRRGICVMASIPLVLATSGCAVDNHGVVLGRITHADGAVVADLYAIGLHLKTRPGDAGVVLGYSRASYVFADLPAKPLPGARWHAFSVPLPAVAPTAIHVESVGASAHATVASSGATLGYRAYTVLAQLRNESSSSFAVRFRPDSPAATRVRNCEEKPSCAH